jgi:hypothetical protein
LLCILDIINQLRFFERLVQKGWKIGRKETYDDEICWCFGKKMEKGTENAYGVSSAGWRENFFDPWIEFVKFLIGIFWNY